MQHHPRLHWSPQGCHRGLSERRQSLALLLRSEIRLFSKRFYFLYTPTKVIYCCGYTFPAYTTFYRYHNDNVTVQRLISLSLFHFLSFCCLHYTSLSIYRLLWRSHSVRLSLRNCITSAESGKERRSSPSTLLMLASNALSAVSMARGTSCNISYWKTE
jgi:hypothetical protein